MEAQGKKILVVDDEEHIRRVLRIDLEAQGYQVLEASSGWAAKALLEDEVVAAVISDIRMPNGSGLELNQFIKDRNPALPPVLFITAFVDIASEDIYEAGVEAIIAKPFDTEEVLEPLRRALTPRSTRWQLAAGTSLLSAAPPAVQVTSLHVQLPQLEFGRGGAFIALEDEFPPAGGVVALSLEGHASASAPLQALGLVRWVRPFGVGALQAGVGLEFLALDAPCYALLEESVKRLQPRAYLPLGRQA